MSVDIPAYLLNPWFNTGEKRALENLTDYIVNNLVDSNIDVIQQDLTQLSNEVTNITSELFPEDGSPNLVWATPNGGIGGPGSFRALVEADLPDTYIPTIAGWDVQTIGDSNMEIEGAADKKISLHETSLTGTSGGLFLGRTALRIPIKDIASAGTETAKGGSNFGSSSTGTWSSAKVNIERTTGVTVTVQTNNGDAEDWKKGDYFTICQTGAGQITVALESGTLRKPTTCNAKTKEQYSCITLTCDDPDPLAPVWTLSGDMEII